MLIFQLRPHQQAIGPALNQLHHLAGPERPPPPEEMNGFQQRRLAGTVVAME
jgi:hypothetical protein